MDVLSFIEKNYEITDQDFMNYIIVALTEENTKQYASASEHYSKAFAMAPNLFILSYEKALCDYKDALAKYESIDKYSNALEDKILRKEYETNKKTTEEIYLNNYVFAIKQMENSEFSEGVKTSFFIELFEEGNEEEIRNSMLKYSAGLPSTLKNNDLLDRLLLHDEVKNHLLKHDVHNNLIINMKIWAVRDNDRAYEKFVQEHGYPDFSIEAEKQIEEKRIEEFNREEEIKKQKIEEERQETRQLEERRSKALKFLPLIIIASVVGLFIIFIILLNLIRAAL